MVLAHCWLRRRDEDCTVETFGIWENFECTSILLE